MPFLFVPFSQSHLGRKTSAECILQTGFWSIFSCVTQFNTTILRQFKFPLKSIFLNMLFTFDQLACLRRLFPATTQLAFHTPRTEMGPLRLIKISEPGSLSYIRTKLFWVYSLRLILKEYKRQDRNHVAADGRSVLASSPSWGARCVRWILLTVSPEVPYLTAVWVCPML